MKPTSYKHFSLQRKFIIMTFLTGIFFMVFMGYLVTKRNNIIMYRNIERQGRLLAETLAIPVMNDLIYERLGLVEEGGLIDNYITGIFKKMMNENLKSFAELKEEIKRAKLNAIEKGLEKLFADVVVDIEFTKHFLDRLNDKRNIKDITDVELRKMYQSVHKLHGPKFKNLGDGFNALLKDFKSNINIPFVLKFDKKNDEVDLIAKTKIAKKELKTKKNTIKE